LSADSAHECVSPTAVTDSEDSKRCELAKDKNLACNLAIQAELYQAGDAKHAMKVIVRFYVSELRRVERILKHLKLTGQRYIELIDAENGFEAVNVEGGVAEEMLSYTTALRGRARVAAYSRAAARTARAEPNMQGLNLTPLHGHTALFGVYGMLGIGLVLFSLRGLKPGVVWNERLLNTCFWSLNIGLALMAAMTLLPIGTIQLLAAIDNGYWYARSAEFMHQPIIELLVWMRMPGDIVFSVGAVALTWFVIRLWISPEREEPLPVGVAVPRERNR
jgi:hypothetical protein